MTLEELAAGWRAKADASIVTDAGRSDVWLSCADELDDWICHHRGEVV